MRHPGRVRPGWSLVGRMVVLAVALAAAYASGRASPRPASAAVRDQGETVATDASATTVPVSQGPATT